VYSGLVLTVARYAGNHWLASWLTHLLINSSVFLAGR
jgi:hypothetical protein